MHPGLEQTTYVNHTSVSCSLILIRAFWELEWSKALVDEVAAEPSPAPSDFYFMGKLWTEDWLTLTGRAKDKKWAFALICPFPYECWVLQIQSKRVLTTPLTKCFLYKRHGLMLPNKSTCFLPYEVKHMKILEGPEMSMGI